MSNIQSFANSATHYFDSLDFVSFNARQGD